MQQVPEHDVVINLAGTSVFTRWTEENKKKYSEQPDFYHQAYCRGSGCGTRAPDQHLLSTSAIGYYGNRGEEELTEDSPPGSDFLAQLSQDWEAEALKARDLGIRVAISRFGIVLGRGGGILGQLVPIFKKFIGGPVGSGKQWFSWIDLSDLVRAYLFVLEHPDLSGPINFTAPQPVRNAELAQAMGKVLHKPSFMPAPAFMVKLALGEFADSVLGGQKVLPAKLQAAGFTFEYPTIEAALRHQIL